MTVTLGDAYRNALHAVDQDAFAEGVVTANRVANVAGIHLMGLRSWLWARRRTATVDLVAGQSYADLPPDCADLLGVELSDSLIRGVRPTTAQDILRRRTSQLAWPQWDYWYTVTRVFPATPAGDADDDLQADQEPYPILELWPTPAQSVAAALTIAYRSAWPGYYGSETRRLAIPDFCEALYLEIVRRVAKGYEEEGDGSVAERLEGLEGTSLFRVAAAADGRLQRDYGPMQNTALGGSGELWTPHGNLGLVADPS